MKQFEITKENEGQRFDKFLSRILSNGGMSFIYKMLRKKNFTLNDKKATGKEILKEFDVVKLYISDETYDKFKTDINNVPKSLEKNKGKVKRNDFCLDIVYEDENIILVNKPEGILSQKATKDDISINEYILDYLFRSDKLSADKLTNYKPSVINRLDRNTTGIIIGAKTLKAARVLSDALKNRTIHKFYKCIVHGKFEGDGTYKAYLQKNVDINKVLISEEKKSAQDELIETDYKLIEYDESRDTSLLEVNLITGKSHQIRAHLAYLGFPIVGDRKYGASELNKRFSARNQLLHAYKIVFPKFSDDTGFEFSDKTIICEPRFKL